MQCVPQRQPLVFQGGETHFWPTSYLPGSHLTHFAPAQSKQLNLMLIDSQVSLHEGHQQTVLPKLLSVTMLT